MGLWQRRPADVLCPQSTSSRRCDLHPRQSHPPHRSQTRIHHPGRHDRGLLRRLTIHPWNGGLSRSPLRCPLRCDAGKGRRHPRPRSFPGYRQCDASRSGVDHGECRGRRPFADNDDLRDRGRDALGGLDRRLAGIAPPLSNAPFRGRPHARPWWSEWLLQGSESTRRPAPHHAGCPGQIQRLACRHVLRFRIAG